MVLSRKVMRNQGLEMGTNLPGFRVRRKVGVDGSGGWKGREEVDDGGPRMGSVFWGKSLTEEVKAHRRQLGLRSLF